MRERPVCLVKAGVFSRRQSEFDQVLMVLPPEDTLPLTRELIYTGITRAREVVALWSDEAVFSAAVKRRTERRSGLRERVLNKQSANQDN